MYRMYPHDMAVTETPNKKRIDGASNGKNSTTRSSRLDSAQVVLGASSLCPHGVIGYKHEPGQYVPFHLEEELGLSNCGHGEKGCTSCTRACPRFGIGKRKRTSICSGGRENRMRCLAF